MAHSPDQALRPGRGALTARVLPGDGQGDALDQEIGGEPAPAQEARPAAASFEAAARAARRRRIRTRALGALRYALAAAGIIAVVLLVRDAGPAALLEVLRGAAKWIPLIVLLEVMRIAADATATWLALGRRVRAVPIRVLARAQLIGTAVGSLAPAGRTAAEATKAALIAPWSGGASATAAAATVQAATLLAGSLISLPCAWAAWALTGPSLITVALLVHAAALFALGAGMRLCMRAQRVGRWLARRQRIAHGAATFQRTARESAVLAPGPTAALLTGRVIQVAQYGLIVHAAGISVTTTQALFSQGLNLISLAVGALVPGQLGVSEGAFVLSSAALGTTGAKAMSIAVLAHLVQVMMIPIGALTPLVWKARRPPASFESIESTEIVEGEALDSTKITERLA